MTTETKDRVFEGRQYGQQIMDKLSVETSSAETFKPGDSRENYIQTMENKIDQLESMMKDMKEKSKSLKNDAKTEFEEEYTKLQQRYNLAKTKLNDIRQSGGDAWKELHDGALAAWRDLADGIKSAVGKFR